MEEKRHEKQVHKKTVYGTKLLMVMAVVFILSIIIMTLMNLLKKDQPYSASENRALEEKPSISLAKVENGRYMREFERYQTDQFFGRETWLQIQVNVKKMLGERESNGVFLGRDSYLLEDISKVDSKNLKKNIKGIKAFHQSYPNVNCYMILVPNAANILKKDLPAFAVTKDQKKQISDVKRKLEDSVIWLDASAALEKKTNQKLYYRTDHHWTTEAARLVFKSVAKEMGIEKTVSMKPYTVTTDFNGTLSAESGYRTGYREPIDIYVQTGDSPVEVVVNDTEKQEKTVSMYDSAKLKGKDKYGVFFGGNHPELSIRTTSSSNRRLLVFKDSYANCFLPFLVPYYREIIVIDPRYFYEDITTIMKDNEIDDVLFLYNGNTFFEDTSLGGVLKNG